MEKMQLKNYQFGCFMGFYGHHKLLGQSKIAPIFLNLSATMSLKLLLSIVKNLQFS